jgi:hypothetical protein|tara:strand:+ start:6249 stop:6668 length:420 start_codon:yes stop_codon:yes gene_type:complete
MMFMHTYHNFDQRNPLILLWMLLWYRVPDKGKRIFVITSLYVRLLGLEEPTDRQLEEINKAFSLTKKTKALRFPALAACWVWRKLLPISKTAFHSDENVDHYINRLMKRTPCWLWYADYEQRRKDIKELIENIQARHPA